MKLVSKLKSKPGVYKITNLANGKVCGRYWKNRNGQIFLKTVFWKITK